MRLLYAICWQDAYEPWGWAPATFEDAPHDLMPNGPFFWDKSEADEILARVIDRTAKQALENLREQDRNRHQVDVERYEEEVARGGSGPGVSVRLVDRPEPKWKPTEPRPLRTEADLEVSASKLASNEWSIQTYEVPEQ